MVDADRFVEGTSVKVGRLVATIVGGILISYVAGMWQFFSMIAGLVGRFYLAPYETLVDLATEAVMIPIELLETGWASAAAWVTGPGSALGVWLFPLAMIVTAITLLTLDWGLRRMGVLS